MLENYIHIYIHTHTYIYLYYKFYLSKNMFMANTFDYFLFSRSLIIFCLLEVLRGLVFWGTRF